MIKLFVLLLTTTLLTLNATPLLKTGQTQSYDAEGSVVTDGSVKDDGYYQAGVARSYNRTERGIITDYVTGLEWYDYDIIEKSKHEASSYCSDLYVDYGEWRLPSIEELETLVDNSKYNPSITDIFYDIASGPYWSSSIDASHSGDTWSVSFNYGSSSPYYEGSINYVLCVRGEQLNSSDLSRNNKIISDRNTGLEWQDNEDVNSTQITWQEAINYCENDLTLGGYNDWRLPNKTELLSIVDRSRYSPSIDNTIFVHTASNHYWSSTLYSYNSNKVWSISFGYGYSDGYSKTDNYDVRCVRGGQVSNLEPVITIPPTAINHTYNTSQGSSVTGNLFFDNDAGFDPAVETVKAYQLSTPNHGTLEFNQDSGEFTYTQEELFVGVDKFIYNVITDDGASNVATVSINIGFSTANTPPSVVITASVNQVEIDEVITFEARATDSDGSIAKYEWLFSDGATSTEQNPIHSFKVPGVYLAMCKVTDDDGAFGKSITIIISVTDPLEVDLGIKTWNYNITNVGSVANEFTVFMYASKDDNVITDLCEKYNFTIGGEDGFRLTNRECNIVDGEDTFLNGYKRYKVDFKLTGAKYFKDASIQIKDKNTGEYNYLKNLSGISVYGTDFDMKVHAFNFANGGWNIIDGVIKTSGDITDPDVIFTNQFGKDAQVIASWLHEDNRMTFYNSVGYKLDGQGSDAEHSNSGMCTGMAYTAAANYNHRNDSTYWDIRTELSLGKSFNMVISDHWDRDNQETNSSESKPFQYENINKDEDKSSLDALRKIMYYSVGQPYFYRDSLDTWVGNQGSIKPGKDYPIYLNLTIKDHHMDIFQMLEDDLVNEVAIQYAYSNLAHSVALTQYIGFNCSECTSETKKWFVYNNNFPYDNSSENSAFQFISTNTMDKYFVNKLTGKNSDDYGFLDKIIINAVGDNIIPEGYSKSDPLNILRSISRSSAQSTSSITTAINYLKIMLAGGDVTEIRDVNDNIILLIEDGELDGVQSVVHHSNAFTTLYLPANNTYTISATKYASYPFLEVLQHLPKNDGSVDIVNYHDAQLGETDATQISFKVGVDNTDKTLTQLAGSESSVSTASLKRSVRAASTVAPDHDGSVLQSLSSPSSFSGAMSGVSVVLNWTNSTHPLFAETYVIRKVGTQPEDILDGTLIYSGAATTSVDVDINSDTLYYYGAFTIDVNSSVSEPVCVSVDTTTLSIFGSVIDEETLAGVSSAQITLNDGEGNFIDSTNTDSGGLYVFSNLEDGNYSVKASLANYIVNTLEHNLSLPTLLNRADFNATAQEMVSFTTRFEKIDVNKITALRWSFRNIAQDDTVRVNLDVGSGWQELNSGIVITDSYDFNSNQNVYYGAQLKLTLNSNLDVNDTFTFNITNKKSEYIEGFIKEIYQQTPNQEEMLTWLSQLDGESAASVALDFLSSQEFAELNLDTDESYIDFTFKLLLDRTPSEEEKTEWLNQLSGSETRESFVYNILNSQEFYDQSVAMGVTAIREIDQLFPAINPAIINYLLG